jgi:hypothetical protein
MKKEIKKSTSIAITILLIPNCLLYIIYDMPPIATESSVK